MPPSISLVEGAGAAARRRDGLPPVGRVAGRFVMANLVVVTLLFGGSVWATRQAATDEAIADARRTTELLATLVVEPTLQSGLAEGGAEAGAEAVAAMDAALRGRLDAASVDRLLIWRGDGTVVYSDDAGLIGERLPPGEAPPVPREGTTRAEVGDVSRPEHRLDGTSEQVLEVYRQVRDPAGRALVLETRTSYGAATARQADIWWHFAPISLTVLLALLALQLPLASRMLAKVRAEQREREALQARALESSDEERRRIAGSLHDGIVQDVSAAALLVAGAADQLRDTSGRHSAQDVAGVLGEAATALRGSAGSLRSLLVEIYPPDLQRAGLASALADLADRLRARGIDVQVRVPEELELPLDAATLLFRVAQEVLQNAAKHSGAGLVEVTVTRLADRVVLDVRDDGAGFDLEATLRRPHDGHLGLDLLTDLAAAGDAGLDIRTAAGAGTHVRLEVPLSSAG
ncbi:sensor histidine kinase [Trujillonella humicola]|uniref:sensor histidine kinase n=1 Tax=Trujillonella humicola TaxID=3383699 RepID=UPI003906A92C